MTESSVNGALNVSVPVDVHSAHEIVTLPPDVELTASVVTADWLPWLAVMFVVPDVLPAVASPELEMVAILVEDEVQVTDDVTFCVVPLPNVPVAVNCWVPPN